MRDVVLPSSRCRIFSQAAQKSSEFMCACTTGSILSRWQQAGSVPQPRVRNREQSARNFLLEMVILRTTGELFGILPSRP